MDPSDGMTQYHTRRLPAGSIALGMAAVVAAISIGYAQFKQSPAPVVANSTDPTVMLEQRTIDNPGDGAAWAALGVAQFQAGRFGEAVGAYEKATSASPSSAVLWSALGEAQVMASEHDPMPAAAVKNFERALSFDSKDPRARYFMAVRKDLSGDHRGAIADWLVLFADTPPGAPWDADLRRTIEQVGKINKIDVAARLAAVRRPAQQMPPAFAAIPGPSATDLQAAGAIPPSRQRDMAEGMVARLEARLKGDPQNVDGWIMLIRSRLTLGQSDKASRALGDALAANPDKAGMLREQASALGVK